MEHENDDDIPLFAKPAKNRVLVYKVNELPRPYFSFVLGSALHRPADWADIGFEAWNEEQDRRKSIYRLMTKEERKVFDKYCCLRDE
jgi:hypothetical protein